MQYLDYDESALNAMRDEMLKQEKEDNMRRNLIRNKLLKTNVIYQGTGAKSAGGKMKKKVKKVKKAGMAPTAGCGPMCSWRDYLKKYRELNPNLSLKEAMQGASPNYKAGVLLGGKKTKVNKKVKRSNVVSKLDNDLKNKKKVLDRLKKELKLIKSHLLK